MLPLVKTDERAISSHHEGGHGLLHVHYEIPFDHIELADTNPLLIRSSGKEIRALGFIDSPYPSDVYRVVVEQNPELLDSCRREAELQMACAYAGPVAQARFVGCSLPAAVMAGGSGDYAFIARLTSLWWTDRGEHFQNAKLAERRARKLIRSPQGWAVIEKIAVKLFHTGNVDFDECYDIYTDVYGRTPPPFNGWRVDC